MREQAEKRKSPERGQVQPEGSAEFAWIGSSDAAESAIPLHSSENLKQDDACANWNSAARNCRISAWGIEGCKSGRKQNEHQQVQGNA